MNACGEQLQKRETLKKQDFLNSCNAVLQITTYIADSLCLQACILWDVYMNPNKLVDLLIVTTCIQMFQA